MDAVLFFFVACCFVCRSRSTAYRRKMIHILTDRRTEIRAHISSKRLLRGLYVKLVQIVEMDVPVCLRRNFDRYLYILRDSIYEYYGRNRSAFILYSERVVARPLPSSFHTIRSSTNKITLLSLITKSIIPLRYT